MRPMPHRSDSRPPRAPGAGRSSVRAVAGLGLALLVGALALLPSAAVADELPEGYAYEMVTAPFTAGQRALMDASTPDGGLVLYGSSGGFAGTPNLMQTGIQYLARRGESGWQTTPLAPPATDYPYLDWAGLRDQSDDLSRTLWTATAAADWGTQRITPVVRDLDGTVRAVGPVIDETLSQLKTPLVGTSSDLSTVVIYARDRPALTDGTVDTRPTSRSSLILSTLRPDGSLAVRQVAYRAGATMFPTCDVQLGGLTAAGTGPLPSSVPVSGRGAVSNDAAGTMKIFFTFAGASPACRTAATLRVWVKIGDADPIDLAESQCTTDCGAIQRAAFEGGSRDGKRVYFSTEQKLVDGDQDSEAGTKIDLYEYDFGATGNKLIPVTIGSSATGAGVLRLVRASPDGSHAYFVANGRPLTGANARGVTPQQGDNNLYVYQRKPGEASGTTTFIAALPTTDAGDLWTGGDARRRVITSDDGRYLLITSRGDLTGDRLPGDVFQDIYRYDAATDELLRIWSPDPAHNGAERTAGAYVGGTPATQTDGGFQRWWQMLGSRRQITEDGETVIFDTDEPLSPNDVNDQMDVYTWQASTGDLTMISSGRSAVPARQAGITPSGNSLFLTTDYPFVRAHTSGSVATYVLRRGGGFPDAPAPPDPCKGDACQGSLVAVPATAPVGSVDFSGEGNVPLASASVTVSRLKAVAGSSAKLRVRVPAAGRISVSGASIRPASKSATKAATYTVRVTLGPKAKRKLKNKKTLKVRVSVAFQTRPGVSASKKVTLTFKAPKDKKLEKGGR